MGLKRSQSIGSTVGDPNVGLQLEAQVSPPPKQAARSEYGRRVRALELYRLDLPLSPLSCGKAMEGVSAVLDVTSGRVAQATVHCHRASTPLSWDDGVSALRSQPSALNCRAKSSTVTAMAARATLAARSHTADIPCDGYKYTSLRCRWAHTAQIQVNRLHCRSSLLRAPQSYPPIASPYISSHGV